MVSTGTGFEVASYSLQYAQERLQRRIGMMCARTGCRVDTNAFAIIFHSRERRWIALKLRRSRTAAVGIVLNPVITARPGTNRGGQTLKCWIAPLNGAYGQVNVGIKSTSKRRLAVGIWHLAFGIWH